MCEKSPQEMGDAYFAYLLETIELNKHYPEVKRVLEHAAHAFIKTHGRWDLTASLQEGLTEN